MNGVCVLELIVFLVAAVVAATPPMAALACVLVPAVLLNALLFIAGFASALLAELKAPPNFVSSVALGDSTERSEGSFMGPLLRWIGLASVPGAGLKGLISPASIALISFMAVAVLKALWSFSLGSSAIGIALTGPK